MRSASTDVDGSFQAGDAVWVIGEGEDEPLGKGISEYSSRDVCAQRAGTERLHARALLPMPPEEVIHRDRFVLL